jgi:hypothetical protein
MRIMASATFAALLLATTLPALADDFEFGPLSTQPKTNQKTIRTRHGTRIAKIVRSMWCLDNAPSLMEAVRYRMSA